MNIKRIIGYLILSIVIILNVSCVNSAGDQEYLVTTIAGRDPKFYLPMRVAIDKDGAIIVSDIDDDLIRKIDSNGVVTIIAGSTEGYADGTGTRAQFSYPSDVAIDNAGAIIVADTFNKRIRKIDSNGVVTTIAGSTFGYADGTGTNAQFRSPKGVAIDNDGAIIVADSGLIRKIKIK